MIKINADYLRLAMLCASTEETRYYLNGVYVEPHHENGVLLVATDGHRLIVIHDANGVCNGLPVIIRRDKDFLKACKTDRKAEYPRIVEIENDIASVKVPDVEGNTNGISAAQMASPFIDGTYPDYRRVVPDYHEGQCGAFNSSYLADFGKIAAELTGQRQAHIKLRAKDETSPALVQLNTPIAFGVLMPIRDTSPTGLPDFWTTHMEPADNPMIKEAEKIAETA